MPTISESQIMRVGDRTAILLAIVAGLACLVPLLLTPVLPFIDFYLHILRYYVLAHAGAGSSFAANYLPAWALLPNLGLDVLGTAILWVVPPLLAAKLIVALIILTLFAGVLYLAHALQGRVTLLTVAWRGSSSTAIFSSGASRTSCWVLGSRSAASASGSPTGTGPTGSSAFPPCSP